MELATRRVHFAGVTPSPDDTWMKQIARNLTAADAGFLLGKRYGPAAPAGIGVPNQMRSRQRPAGRKLLYED